MCFQCQFSVGLRWAVHRHKIASNWAKNWHRRRMFRLNFVPIRSDPRITFLSGNQPLDLFTNLTIRVRWIDSTNLSIRVRSTGPTNLTIAPIFTAYLSLTKALRLIHQLTIRDRWIDSTNLSIRVRIRRIKPFVFDGLNQTCSNQFPPLLRYEIHESYRWSRFDSIGQPLRQRGHENGVEMALYFHI